MVIRYVYKEVLTLPLNGRPEHLVKLKHVSIRHLL